MIYLNLLLTLVLLACWVALRRAHQQAATAKEHKAQLQGELCALRANHRALMRATISVNGGIFKRIDEIREITLAIERHNPTLFDRVPGLLHWLRASDAYLSGLRDTAMPAGASPSDDAQRVFWVGTGRHEHIYDEIRTRLRLVA